MKTALIVALICVNVGLLAALMLGSGVERADAQVRRTDYVMVTAQVTDNYDAIYIIDLGSRKFTAVGIDKRTKRFQPVVKRPRDLYRDFARTR